jgi:hypothetical protein
MADVIDGTSNTFLAGERETLDCRSGTWVGVRNSNAIGAQGASVVIGHSRPVINFVNAAVPWNTTGGTGCMVGFSSLHPGGAQFALCDGSTRFVSETIDHFWFGTTSNGTVADSQDPLNRTYQRLMTRDDRLPVTLP